MEVRHTNKVDAAICEAHSPVCTDSPSKVEPIQPQPQRGLKMKEGMIPASRGAGGGILASPARPTLNSFTFSMPSNEDDRSVASTITMSTIKTDRSSTLDVFDFPEDTLEGNLMNDVAPINLEESSNSTPAEAGCVHFEKAMDSVFVKIYEMFLDDEAVMFACQDEPTTGTPFLEYSSVPDIPAVISMTSDPAHEPDWNEESKKKEENLAISKDDEDRVTPTPKELTHTEMDDQKERRSTSPKDLNSVVRKESTEITDKDDDESNSSPWRLDSILYPDRRDECIEVGEAGQVVFEETTIEFEFEPLFFSPPKTESLTNAPQTAPAAKPREIQAPSHKNRDSLLSQPVESQKQPSTNSLTSSTSKSSTSKKRSLGLRYLFSPRLRKFYVLPWKRRSFKKYQNMQKLDDSSYSPETVTTLEPSTLHSDGLSFQCDMSLKTSSVMSLKTASVLMKQELQSTSPRRDMDRGGISYAYPQAMVA